MFDITASPQNKKVQIQLGKLAERQFEGIRKAFYYSGKDLIITSRQLIKNPQKTGKTYRKRNPRTGRIEVHQASAFGEPPANFTGDLARSIDFKVSGANTMEFGSKEITSSYPNQAFVDYGRYLEPDAKLNRPFLINAIKRNYRNIQIHFEREIKKSISR